MGLSSFLSVLLLSLFMALSFTNGFGRKMSLVEAVDPHHHGSTPQLKRNEEKFRMMMMETMDYADPEPNTNIRGGYVSPPPPPPIYG